jgi:hypothetical protein
VRKGFDRAYYGFIFFGFKTKTPSLRLGFCAAAALLNFPRKFHESHPHSSLGAYLENHVIETPQTCSRIHRSMPWRPKKTSQEIGMDSGQAHLVFLHHACFHTRFSLLSFTLLDTEDRAEIFRQHSHSQCARIL